MYNEEFLCFYYAIFMRHTRIERDNKFFKSTLTNWRLLF